MSVSPVHDMAARTTYTSPQRVSSVLSPLKRRASNVDYDTVDSHRETKKRVLEPSTAIPVQKNEVRICAFFCARRSRTYCEFLWSLEPQHSAAQRCASRHRNACQGALLPSLQTAIRSSATRRLAVLRGPSAPLGWRHGTHRSQGGYSGTAVPNHWRDDEGLPGGSQLWLPVAGY